MDFTAYVESKKKEARLANIEEVRREIDHSWVKTKIENHIAAFDGIMSAEEVREAILTNIIVASKFCKDPGKQNISEKLAAEVLGLNKLPAQGKNCIRFNNSGDIVSVSSGNTKSADFILNEYYATQKYTTDEGGAQDNQRNDVIDFLTRGSIQYKVAAIVDGPYWDKHRDELITMFADNPNVLITSVTELTKNS
jgi:hypothetical protein